MASPLPNVRLSTEIVRRSDPAVNPDAMILLETTDVPITIDVRRPDRFLGRVPGKVRFRGRFKLRFDQYDELRPVLVFAEAGRLTRPDPLQTEVWFHYVAAWAQRQRQLIAFLVGHLELDELPRSGLSREKGGWIYRFPRGPRIKRPTDPLLEIPEETPPAPTWQRCSPRVTVRRAVTFFGGKDSLDGTVYNISNEGLFILTADPLPPRGIEVIVFYRVGREKLSMVGRVRWHARAMAGELGGFGLELRDFGDGCGGRKWRAHVRDEAEITVDF